MEEMSRRRHSPVTLLVASFALLATLPAPCVCLPDPVAAAQHACCEPPAGVRPAVPACCAAADVAPDATTAPSVTPAVAPALVVVAWGTPPAVSVPDRGQASPTPAVSPPLSVRRL
jgi:hypothetical protein